MVWARILTVMALTGCWGATPSTEPKLVPSPSGLVITESGFGPIGDKTVATLTNLRALLPSYRVVPINDPGLEYQIYDGKEQLGFVVLDDDASIYNIHATSGKVSVANRTWRAGQAFQGAKDLTRCECWGNNPTCYRQGEHVAVSFNRACVETKDPRVLRVLDGVVIQRVIWSATAFGAKAAEQPAEDDGEAP